MMFSCLKFCSMLEFKTVAHPSPSNCLSAAPFINQDECHTHEPNQFVRSALDVNNRRLARSSSLNQINADRLQRFARRGVQGALKLGERVITDDRCRQSGRLLGPDDPVRVSRVRESTAERNASLASVVVLADLEIPFELRQMLDIFKLYEVKSQWDEGSGDV